MFKKLTLAAAVGAGYVLGAKAGKERYAQIESKFREIAGMPAVQNATSAVKENAAPLIDSAKETVSDKVSAVSEKASGSDKGSGSSSSSASSSKPASPAASGAGAATRPTTPTTPPAPGAAPSVTAQIPRP